MRWGARTGEWGNDSFGDVVPTVSSADALAPQYDPTQMLVPTAPVVDVNTGRPMMMPSGPGGTPYPPPAKPRISPMMLLGAGIVAYLLFA